MLRRRPGARPVTALVDALITGPYVDRLNPGGRWRGSANQRLVVMSELGRGRYTGEHEDLGTPAPHAAAPPAHGVPRVQVASDGQRLWLIGIPEPGALQRLENDLTERGIDVSEASWRD
jgi:anaerobic ribonucleoside-triphosphate reductase activating protein